jgi:type VI secretion system protein ImpG
MFSHYYNAELTFLREVGRAFAQVNPNVAELLAERGGDPDVDRLLEGCAFLTARIRERIDDSVPEIVHGLTELLLPHYLRPIPAASIVQFTAAAGLRARVKVPRGAELGSTQVDGVSCRFRTTSEVDLLPLALRDVQLDRSVAAAPVLRLKFETNEPGIPAVFQQKGIRLFLAGELPTAATLFLWLAHHCRAITVTGAGGAAVTLPKTSIRLPGFEPEHALLPWPALSLQGYRLLQEYFTMPAKFLFVDVENLQLASSVAADRFELAFTLDRPPELTGRLGPELFQLHCTPVINLFETSATPIRRDPLAHEHPLRAIDLDQHSAEVFEVRTVTGLRLGEPRPIDYQPFFDFAHEQPEVTGARGGARAGEVSYYRMRRVASPLDNATDGYLTVLTPRDVAPPAGEETLSIALTCTNRNLPEQLRAGDISVPTAATPATVKFRNITAVTPPCHPPLGSELHWRLLSHLALNNRSLATAESLRALLSLYNLQKLAEQQAGLANQLRVEAVQRVSGDRAFRVVEGSTVLGTSLTVDVAESGFGFLKGDAYLFGAVLEAMLGEHVTLNAFSELTLRLLPSRTEYRWRPRSGRQQLL